MNTRTTSRFVAGIATLAVAASLAGPASADPSPSSAAGADWLSSELEAGLFENFQFGGVDGGLNIDAGLAFVQSGDTASATALRNELEPETDGYITGEAFGDPGSTYANALGKLLAFVEASGGDPTDYDGKNLVTRLEAQVGDGTGDTPNGELFDTSDFGSYTNVLGQAFAAQGLSEVGSAKAGAVTSYLLAQQCADGHFPLGFRTDAKDTCDGDASVDVTALVAVALREQSSNPAVETAVREAGGYIAGVQLAEGSVGGAPPTSEPNANTTGLAAQALGEACDLDSAYRAAAWARDLQVGADQAGTALAGEVGAIAYDAATLTRDSADGIEDSERDQYRRSTSQGANGLVYDATAPATVKLAGPADRFVRAGSRVRLSVSGIQDGDAACLVGPRARILLGDESTTASTQVKLPQRSGTLRYVATTGPGTSTTTVRALGAKTFKIALKKKRVPAGRKQKVTVKGLAKGESVRVKYRGKVVERGNSGNNHRFTTKFKVGKKAGKQKVRVIGEFGNRNAAKKFRVVKGR